MSRTEFANRYNIHVNNISTFKLPEYKVPELKKQLNDTIDEGFKQIHDEWKINLSVEYLTILKYNNDPDGGGRHIAPHNENISTVIALNLTCDAIEGSYQVNLEQSNQAQQGDILYLFVPTVPPGYLIVENPINPVYMRCHNKLLTRIISDSPTSLII